MWKRKKEIEGVSNSSILSLKSIVANEEREVKKLQDEGLVKPKKISKHNVTDTVSNKGINDRIEKDKADQSTLDELENSRIRLIEKSKIYNNLVNTDLFSSINNNDDKINSSKLNKFTNDYNEDHVIDFKEKSYLKFQEKVEAEELKRKAMSEDEYMKRFWEDQKDDSDEDHYNQDEDIDYQEKLKKIEEMNKLSKETQIEKEKVVKEKETSKQLVNERLDKINQLKRISELKKKLNEQKGKK